jgi:hypothetical protein
MKGVLLHTIQVGKLRLWLLISLPFTTLMYTILDACLNIAKATIIFVMSVSMSVRPSFRM